VERAAPREHGGHERVLVRVRIELDVAFVAAGHVGADEHPLAQQQVVGERLVAQVPEADRGERLDRARLDALARVGSGVPQIASTNPTSTGR
jgi:hypothetical protein